jgi:PKHD-type hydroxylase
MQSAVPDTDSRAMLFDLDQSIQALSVGRATNDADVDRLIQIYHNLLRKWAVV